MPLRIQKKPQGRYLLFRYKKSGSWVDRYIGTLFISPTPILDCVLENLDRLNIDELQRIKRTPKHWRPIL